MREEDILFLDNHLLVVNKPAGIPTQENPLFQFSLEKLAKEWLKTHFKKEGNVFLHSIHRLDRLVSGIVVFARSSKALSRMSEAIRQKKCHKIYHALVEGCPNQKGVLRHFLKHDEFHASVVSENVRDAQFCELYYALIEKQPSRSLVEITLVTGRYHQIRAQFGSIGHPIIGDAKYGSRKASYHPQAIFLHHQKFSITHPTQNIEMEWKAPYPKAWNSH